MSFTEPVRVHCFQIGYNLTLNGKVELAKVDRLIFMTLQRKLHEFPMNRHQIIADQLC